MWVCWLTHFVSYRHEWRGHFPFWWHAGRSLNHHGSFVCTQEKLEAPDAVRCVSGSQTFFARPPLTLQEYSTSLSTHFSKNVSVCKMGLKASNCGIQSVHELKRRTNCDPCLCRGRYQRHNVFLLRQWLDTSLLHYRPLDVEVVMFSFCERWVWLHYHSVGANNNKNVSITPNFRSFAPSWNAHSKPDRNNLALSRVRLLILTLIIQLTTQGFHHLWSQAENNQQCVHSWL